MKSITLCEESRERLIADAGYLVANGWKMVAPPELVEGQAWMAHLEVAGDSEIRLRDAMRNVEIQANQSSDEDLAKAIREAFLKLPELYGKIESAKELLWDYHRALDTRQHAGISASVLIHELEKLLETPWVRGATERSARPGAHLCNGKCTPGDYDDACPLHGSGVNIAP